MPPSLFDAEEDGVTFLKRDPQIEARKVQLNQVYPVGVRIPRQASGPTWVPTYAEDLCWLVPIVDRLYLGVSDPPLVISVQRKIPFQPGAGNSAPLLAGYCALEGAKTCPSIPP